MIFFIYMYTLSFMMFYACVHQTLSYPTTSQAQPRSGSDPLGGLKRHWPRVSVPAPGNPRVSWGFSTPCWSIRGYAHENETTYRYQ